MRRGVSDGGKDAPKFWDDEMKSIGTSLDNVLWLTLYPAKESANATQSRLATWSSSCSVIEKRWAPWKPRRYGNEQRGHPADLPGLRMPDGIRECTEAWIAGALPRVVGHRDSAAIVLANEPQKRALRFVIA